jgi:integrase
MSVKHVTINGSQKVWMARIAYRGVRKSRVCRTKEEARQAERELSAACRQEAERAEREGASPATVKHLCEYYVLDLERRGKGPATIGRAVTTAKAIEAVAPALLAMPVSRVTARDVYDFRQARLVAGSKPSTINRDLRSLRAMLKQARPDFRFPGSAFLPEDETRVRWLRPEEEILVLQTMPSPFREMATLAALTLMRQGEIIALRREHVHLEQGVIMLPRAKAGARPVILSGEAQKILRGQLAAHESAWVFPGPSGAPYHRDYVGRTFRKAARAAGLRDFHFHDLRHHGATTALNRGFTAPIVMALGGWKTERMMRRYAAVTDQTLRAAAEAVSGNEPWQWSAKSPSIQPSSPPLQAEVAGSSPAPPTIVSVTRVSVTRAPESRRPLLHGAAGQSGRVNPTTASRPGRESPRLPG